MSKELGRLKSPICTNITFWQKPRPEVSGEAGTEGKNQKDAEKLTDSKYPLLPSLPLLGDSKQNSNHRAEAQSKGQG